MGSGPWGGHGRVSFDDATLPTCTVGLCEGHGADDLLPYEIMGRRYSNLEFYNAMSPLRDDLPYVYDNFRWSHCVTRATIRSGEFGR